MSAFTFRPAVAMAQRGGDAARDRALSTLFEAHLDSVFGYLLARSGDRQVAEDVAGETFAEAARLFAAGRGAEVGRPWLLDVAKKRLIDHWRRENRHRRRVDRMIQTRGDHWRDTNDEHPVEIESMVLDALDTLSDRQRAVLVLRYLDGYSVSEVAHTLGISYQATESLLARARRSLIAAYEATQ